MLHLFGKKTAIKNRWVLLSGWLLCCQSSMAQYYGRADINKPDQDSKPYYFGITIGASSSRFQTELSPRFLQDDSIYVAEPVNSGGFNLGLHVTTRLSNRFQLRFNPQLMFMERNLYYKLRFPDIDGMLEVTKKVESVTMSFPLQIKFQSDRIGNFRVYTLAGFKADIDMASNARKKRLDDVVKIEKYDFGPEFGIGFSFFFESFIFSPELKISNGLRDIHARDPNLKFSSVFDKIQSRMIVLSIHLEG
jgi:hypothetical protein